MCGLVGIASSTLTLMEREIFNKLMILSSFRGTDSSGVLLVGRKGLGNKQKVKINLHKSTDNPLSFIESNLYVDKVEDNNPFVMAGHTRWATVGSIKAANAHPFMINGITGMHNGSVKSLPVGKDSTDSEEIFRLISTIGLEKTLEQIRFGAYCLVYVDHAKRTLNFIRNNERPLFFMKTKSNCFVWASERRMLEFIRPDFVTNEDTTEIHSLPVNTLVTMNLSDFTFKETKMEVQPPIPFLLPGPTKTTTTTTTPTGTDRSVLKRVSRLFNSVINPIEYSRVYPYRDDRVEDTIKVHNLKNASYSGWRETKYTLLYAEKKLSEGCNCCGTQAKLQDVVWWTDYGTYYCDLCWNEPGMKDYYAISKGQFFKGALHNVVN